MCEKIAIIASGGGLSCSYSAGAVLALIKKYNLKHPDIAIGISGSSGTLAYYTAGQYENIKKIWLNLLPDRKFLNPLRFWEMMDIDYLIDEKFARKLPLNVKKVLKSKTHFLIPVTSYPSGRVEYLSNRDEDDIMDALRAGMALRIAFRKIITIHQKEYCDTWASSSVNKSIRKAMSLGATKIIVIDNETSTRVSNMLYGIWLMLQGKQFRRNHDRVYFMKEVCRVAKGTKIIFLRPKKMIMVHTLTNNKTLVKRTLQQGYRETMMDKDLEGFMNFKRK